MNIFAVIVPVKQKSWQETLTHWHISQIRKAPSVASSWLSWISTLMTWTGCRVSCSLEFRSKKQQKKGNIRQPVRNVISRINDYFFYSVLTNLLHPFSEKTFVIRSLTFYHLVIHSFFTGDDQVKLILAVLEALWFWFDAFVAVQHVQDAILCVSEE